MRFAVIGLSHVHIISMAQALLGVNGTRGAAEYLVANWRRLSTSYDDRAFAWCLSFPPAGQDPNGWRHATVLQRFPD